MGQYFTPVIGNNDTSGRFTPRLWINAHDWDNGLKFMEFSYTTNPIVVAMMDLLKIPQETKLESHLFSRVVWAGDYEDVPEGEETVYERASVVYAQRKLAPVPYKPNQHLKYILNLEKREYVDQSKCPPTTHGLVISPLAVLTTTGGYYGSDEEYSGRWKGDLIATTTLKSKIPKDYTEITPRFIEGG
jgi:hypothetical protein